MVDRANHACLATVALALALAIGSGPAYALRVAWNVDVHQNKFADFANDFHVWGVLESGDELGNCPPTFVGEVNFLIPPTAPPTQAFPTFSQTITPSAGGMWPPGLPFYDFTANWSGANIAHCQWVHFGLEFDEACHNVGYWLQAAWTRDGVDPGLSPIMGFRVEDLAPTQTFTLQNYSDVEIHLTQVDVLVLPPGADFPLENLNYDYFEANPGYDWVPVTVPADTWLAGNGEEFQLNIEDVLGRRLGFSEILISRQRGEYSGSPTEEFWEFELHEAHIPEPLTMLAFGAGVVGLAGYVRRRRA